MTSRILHIVGGMDKGGTETMLMNLYRKIDRNKIQFDFVYTTEKETYYDKEILKLGGKIIRISPTSKLGINKSINAITKVILENGPYRVVHAHTLFNCGIAMIAAKKINIDIRISHAHTTADNESGLSRKIYIYIMRKLILKNSTKLLACSDLAASYLFGKENIKLSKYTLLPNLISYENIIDINNNDISRFRIDNNLNEDDIVIGHIGTFKKSKNQEYLLEIVAHLKNTNKKIKLLLIGDGSMRQELENMVKDLNIEDKVIFMGIRDDIDVILNCVDIFVFPSIFEGLGLVLLEAQAAGLPCVVSEAIQPEADLQLGLFNKLNLSDGVQVWSDKIIEVAGKKETDKQKILNAFDEQGYSVQKCISKLLSVYGVDE